MHFQVNTRRIRNIFFYAITFKTKVEENSQINIFISFLCILNSLYHIYECVCLLCKFKNEFQIRTQVYNTEIWQRQI